MVLRARAHGLDPAMSKLESWLMAHFEAALMHITNNHFKTLFRVNWGIYGPKLSKNSLKMAKNEPNCQFSRIFGYIMGTQGPRDPVLVPKESSH